MKKRILIMLFEILCVFSTVTFSALADEDIWICESCGRANQIGEPYCAYCGKERYYKGGVNEAGKIDFVNGFFWDTSQEGISENLMMDLNTMVMITKCISFRLPESWANGVQFTYNENFISFSCASVAASESEEDGLLCVIYREEKKQTNKTEYYIGKDDRYWYYFETYSDHADQKDKESFEIYKEQSSEFDIIRDSILIENEL